MGIILWNSGRLEYSLYVIFRAVTYSNLVVCRAIIQCHSVGMFSRVQALFAKYRMIVLSGVGYKIPALLEVVIGILS